GTGGDGHVALEGAEPGDLCDHFVLARGEGRSREGAVAARRQCALDAGGLVANGHRGAGNDCAGLIVDRPRNGPDRFLRPRAGGYEDGETGAESVTNDGRSRGARTASRSRPVHHDALLAWRPTDRSVGSNGRRKIG